MSRALLSWKTWRNPCPLGRMLGSQRLRIAKEAFESSRNTLEYRRMNAPRTAAQQSALALAGLRIAVGCLFLIFGQYKVFGTAFTLHGGFQWWINKFLQDGAAYPFIIPVLTGFVLPHATAVAFLE